MTAIVVLSSLLLGVLLVLFAVIAYAFKLRKQKFGMMALPSDLEKGRRYELLAQASWEGKCCVVLRKGNSEICVEVSKPFLSSTESVHVVEVRDLIGNPHWDLKSFSHHHPTEALNPGETGFQGRLTDVMG